jgi:hypothetical protein
VHDLPRELPAGRLVQLRFQSAGSSGELALEALVAWSQPERAGFTFRDVPDETRRALEALLAELGAAAREPAGPGTDAAPRAPAQNRGLSRPR